MHLHRGVDHPLRRFGCGQLGHRRLLRRALAAHVAQPRRAVGEQRRGIDVRGHLAQCRQRQVAVGQPAAEHRARAGVRQRFVQRAAREPDRGGGDRCAKDVERAHRELEAVALAAEQRVRGKATCAELDAGERMRRDHGDALRDVHARRSGGYHERGNALGAGCGAGAREHAIEVGDAAVGDPRLAAVEHPVRAIAHRARRHRRDIGPGVRLRQRKGRDRLAARDRRQPTRALRVGPRERDRAAAQSLHREREIGEAVVIRERFARDAQRARVERGQRAAVRGRHAIAQPACGTQRPHQLPARRVDVGLGIGAAQRGQRGAPRRQSARQVAMGIGEERPEQMVAVHVSREGPPRPTDRPPGGSERSERGGMFHSGRAAPTD